jgi:hypothetical protein
MKYIARIPEQRYDTKVFEASKFVFEPPPEAARARRILIKPCSGYPLPHPATTSRETLEVVVDGIRQVSEADIIFLDGSPRGESMHSIYRELGYDFPRVLTLDVRECVFVEVENPLAKPFTMSAFWLPNVLLSCDYLISVAPFKLFNGRGSFSIWNLLSLLPVSKYRGEAEYGWGTLYESGIERVVADLYFTLPFDLGIVDARKKFVGTDDPTRGRAEEFGKIFVGEPYEVDCEACLAAGVEAEHLKLIKAAKAQFQSQE